MDVIEIKDDEDDDCIFLGTTIMDSSSGQNVTGEIDLECESEGRQKRSVFPTWLYKMEEAEEVDEIPNDIIGKHLFAVKCRKEEIAQKIWDRWHFYMATSKLSGFEGWRKVGWCRGSWVCKNDQCKFYRISPSHQHNTNSWVKKSGCSVQVCFTCGQYAAPVECYAQKLVEFNEDRSIAWVYHLGEHTCLKKPETKCRQKIIERALKETMERVGPKEMQCRMIREQMDN